MLPKVLTLLVLSCLAAATGVATYQDEYAHVVVGLEAWDHQLEVGGSYRGAVIERVLPELPALVVSPANPREWIASILNEPGIRYAEPDIPTLTTDSTYPNDTRYVLQWGPQTVNAPAAWNLGVMGAGNRELCLVDTGIRISHEEFDINNSTRYEGGYDFVHNDGVPEDDYGPGGSGHGTMDVGIATSNTNNSAGIAGVAPEASYWVADVRDAWGGNTSEHAAGFDWCSDNADIISTSMTCGASPCSVLGDAVENAWAAGKLLVASAGNAGGIACAGNCIYYPAHYDETIAVVNVDILGQINAQSSVGPQAELAAPGTTIMGPSKLSDTAYTTEDGTSQAAPHVAGVAALIWNRAPNMPNNVLRDLLDETAADLGATGRDSTFGFGMVDAEAALDQVWPSGLPYCRFNSPTRFDQTAAVRPVLTGTIQFEAWTESVLSSVSSVKIAIDSTDLSMNTTADSMIYERGVNTAAYSNGSHTLTITCTEADSSTRTHQRLYTFTN